MEWRPRACSDAESTSIATTTGHSLKLESGLPTTWERWQRWRRPRPKSRTNDSWQCLSWWRPLDECRSTTSTITNLFTIRTNFYLAGNTPLFLDNMYLFHVYNGTCPFFVDLDTRRMGPPAFRLIHRLHIRSGIISDDVHKLQGRSSPYGGIPRLWQRCIY
jgi:ribosomal protein S10